MLDFGETIASLAFTISTDLVTSIINKIHYKKEIYYNTLATPVINKRLEILSKLFRLISYELRMEFHVFFLQISSSLNKCYYIFEFDAHVFFLLQQCSYKLSKTYGEHQKKLYLHFYLSKVSFLRIIWPYGKIIIHIVTVF